MAIRTELEGTLRLHFGSAVSIIVGRRLAWSARGREEAHCTYTITITVHYLFLTPALVRIAYYFLTYLTANAGAGVGFVARVVVRTCFPRPSETLST